MPPRGTNSYPLPVNGILLVNESYFLSIVVVGRFLVTIFGKELLHLFLLLRGKMSLATMHTIIGSAVAHDIHHSELEGMHIAMFHLVVEMGESPSRLELSHTLEMGARSVEVGIRKDGIAGGNIVRFELCRNESDALSGARAIGIETVHPAVVYQTVYKFRIIQI